MFKKGLFLLMPSLIIPFFTSSSISKGQIKLSPKIVFENDSYESLSLENWIMMNLKKRQLKVTMLI